MGNATNGRLWQPWLKTLEKKVHKLNKKGMKIEEKVRNSNKRYENRREGTNFKGKYAKQRNETFFSASRNNSKHFFRIFVFFKFHETIETWRNSDLFCTVSHFAKLKKETVNPT